MVYMYSAGVLLLCRVGTVRRGHPDRGERGGRREPAGAAAPNARREGSSKMRCPRCETIILDERTRDGVVVDACRECRGIWLDRGELEKLIARSGVEAETRYRDPAPRRRDDDDFDNDDDDDSGRGRRGRRREGFFGSLGDLFD